MLLNHLQGNIPDGTISVAKNDRRQTCGVASPRRGILIMGIVFKRPRAASIHSISPRWSIETTTPKSSAKCVSLSLRQIKSGLRSRRRTTNETCPQYQGNGGAAIDYSNRQCDSSGSPTQKPDDFRRATKMFSGRFWVALVAFFWTVFW